MQGQAPGPMCASRTRCASLKKASLHCPVKAAAEPAAGAMFSSMHHQYRRRSQVSSAAVRQARGSGACDSATNANCLEKGTTHLRAAVRDGHPHAGCACECCAAAQPHCLAGLCCALL